MNDNYILQDTHLHQAPSGKERLKWLGPAFIWMLSSAGSGELLFTPRVAAMYGYTLLWAMLLAIAMKWFINREIGRYTACTGATFLKGVEVAFGKRNWPLFLILVPQALVAVTTIVGLAGAAATALFALIPFPAQLMAGAIIASTTFVILLRKYSVIEKITTALAIVISLTILAAAFSTTPDFTALGKGIIPTVLPGTKMQEVLPWVGFMLSGAAGLMWFSYWTQAVGYGAAKTKPEHPLQLSYINSEKINQLRKWIKHLTLANTIAIGGGLLIALAFMILGAELLFPGQLVPEDKNMAFTLGSMLGKLWGPVGFWFMIIAIVVTFVSGLLAGQDGFSRMYTDGIGLLHFNITKGKKTFDAQKTHIAVVSVLLALLPLLVYLNFREPVQLLKLAGIIEAIHIPLITWFILYINHRTLPPSLRPGWLSFGGTVLAGIFFTAFAIAFFAIG